MPHEPVYHCQVAPGERVPFTCNVEPVPEQIGEDALALVGAAGPVVTATFVLTQLEKQVPVSALT